MRLTTGTRMAAVCTAGLLALAACSDGGDPGGDGDGTDAPDTANDSADDGVVWDADDGEYVMEEAIASGEAALRVWIEEEPLAEAVIAAFNELYPDVRFDVESVPKVDAVDRMALAGEAGHGADVYITAYDQLAQAIEDGTAAPLGEYQSVLEQRVSPAFASVVSSGGAMYAVPVTTESIALFYNATLLEELTGSAEPATTWEEIVELAEEYNDPAVNRWTIRFLAGEIYYAYPVLSSAGWRVYADGDVAEPGFGDASLTDALEYYSGLRDLWNVPSADGTWDTIEMAFAEGETPYVITGPWSFGTFDEGAAANDFSYGVTTLPTVAGGGPAMSLAGLQVAAVSGYTDYPAASRVFANFLASDAGAAAVYDSTGMIPAVDVDHLAGIEGLQDNVQVAGIVQQSAQAELLPQIPQYFWETGNALIVDVWDGLLPALDAQTKAADSYAELAGL